MLVHASGQFYALGNVTQTLLDLVGNIEVLFALKGLSHEIDFKNFYKNSQNLALLRDADGFLIF